MGRCACIAGNLVPKDRFAKSYGQMKPIVLQISVLARNVEMATTMATAPHGLAIFIAKGENPE